MKKYLPTSGEIRPASAKFDPAIKNMKLLDMGAYRLLCSLKEGDVITLMGNKLICHASTAMVRMKIEYKGVPIFLKYAFGNWYTGQKSRGYKLSPTEKAFGSLLRDIETMAILDNINANKSLNKSTIIN